MGNALRREVDRLLRCLRQFSYSWPYKGHRSLADLESRFATYLTTSSVASTMLDPFATMGKTAPADGFAMDFASGAFDDPLESILAGTWAFG